MYKACHDSSVWVTLTDEEISYALGIGRAMRKLSLKEGHRDRRAEEGDKAFNENMAQRIQALGALGELATRKYLDLPMELVTENFSDADLPWEIEVKVMGHDDYGLRIYPRTGNSRRVVGVIIPPGKERDPYRLMGWIKAGDAKQKRWSMAPCNRPLMYAVPQSELEPMAKLKSMVSWMEIV